VGIAPLGCIELADVKAADERDLIIHDQQLAMIASVAARVERVPDALERAILQLLNCRREALEARRHDQVGVAVVDHIVLDAVGFIARLSFIEVLA
jgi:hypothetical protein